MSETIVYEVAWFSIYSDEKTAKVNFEVLDEFADAITFYVKKRNEMLASAKILEPELYFITLTRTKKISCLNEDGITEVREQSIVLKHDGNL